MNHELLTALRYKSEGTDIDFKSEQYRFIGASDHEKAELLKDILAMANAWRDGPGYILVGLKDQRPHPAMVTGITVSIDDAVFQQFVSSKVKPKLTFRYEEHLYEGKTIGVFTIPKQKRSFFLTNPFGGLKKNIVYLRRGSSTEEAEPQEIVDMGLADAGHADINVDLEVLAPDNNPLPEAVGLTYLQFVEELPDYARARPQPGQFDFIHTTSAFQVNADFWREYGEYARINLALISMKFKLHNRSEVQLSNAKLEVVVEALDGQAFQMLAGKDLPEKPRTQWSPILGGHGLPQLLERREARFVVDDAGDTPICHVRFGSLLPGEEGRSTDLLAVIPRGPGRLRLHFRVLAAELAAPQLIERTLESTGETMSLDHKGLIEIGRSTASKKP